MENTIGDVPALTVSFWAVFVTTHPPGARPDRAGKFINKHVISHSKKVLKIFSVRLHIAIRYVL